MACDLIAQRAAEKRAREKALEDLCAQLQSGTAQIVRRGNEVSIEGWDNRAGWCDGCAVRALKAKGDYFADLALAMAIGAEDVRMLTFGHEH